MNACLIYVGVGVAGMFADRPLGDREGSWISHGVASIGAAIKQAGHACRLIDMRHLAGWHELPKHLTSQPVDVFCLSVSAVDYHNALKVVLAIKRNVPKAKIIVGGIHPTILAKDYDLPAIDCVVTGEGEIAIPAVLGDWAAGKTAQRLVAGVRPDLDLLPWADRGLFDYRRELNCRFADDQDLPAITMLAGRGCPFKCTYCQPAESAVFGQPYRMRSPENVVAEMVALHERYQYKSVTFWDDTFTFSKKWIGEFCDRYEKTGIKAKLTSCSRADIICKNEAMIERLAQVGLEWFVIGFESGSQRVLDLIKKGCTVEQNLEAARICRKYGIKVFATYMYGLPTETNDEVLMTARMIDEIAPEMPSPFIFLPIKGTDAHTFCEQRDLILPGVEERGIERTGRWNESIKGVDYAFIKRVMLERHRG